MTSHCCKVGRVAERWGFDDANSELADRRTREKQASLRELTAYFNQEVLRAAMERAGMAPLAGEVENTYQLLTDDSVGSGDRTRARRRLERAGVDVAAVRDDFVSHPTIGSHLRNCLELSEPTETDPVETARERIFKMQSRSEAVARNALEGLAAKGAVDAGEFTVVLDARVLCERCGTQHDVESFLERGGCGCE